MVASTRLTLQRCAMFARTSLRHRRAKAPESAASVLNIFVSASLICASVAPDVVAFSPVHPFVALGAGARKYRRHFVLSSATGEPPAMPIEKDEEDDLDLSSMPWGDFQSWALRDNLRRYLVTIPSLGNSDSEDYETYALWRTMSQDVTELAGYEPDFLMAMYTRELRKQSSEGGHSVGKDFAPPKNPGEELVHHLTSTPGALPYLDQFEFTTEGGVSGRAYGLPGIADGAMITTPAVAEVEATVKKGYVRTEDGNVAYELGVPAGDFYSLDGTAGVVTEKARKAMLETLARTAGTLAKGEAATAGAGLAKTAASGDGDDMLMKLGGSTAILLAGATAMSMLSHHLTVNVFWV